MSSCAAKPSDPLRPRIRSATSPIGGGKRQCAISPWCRLRLGACCMACTDRQPLPSRPSSDPADARPPSAKARHDRPNQRFGVFALPDRGGRLSETPAAAHSPGCHGRVRPCRREGQAPPLRVWRSAFVSAGRSMDRPFSDDRRVSGCTVGFRRKNHLQASFRGV